MARAEGRPGRRPNLAFLGQFCPGYTVTFAGSFVGFAYGLVYGAVAGFGVGRIYDALVERRRS